MHAVILTGGTGTRLRPLTLHTPKPLLPLVNEPFILRPLKMFARCGIKDVVLCTSYKTEAFCKTLGSGKALGLRLRYAHESHPLGTGGALQNARKLLPESGSILVLNGDILHELDIRAFLKFHRRNKAEVSMALTRVPDPTRYGLVRTDTNGHILQFLEKPSWDEVETNTINAGAYLIEPKILDFIPLKGPYSLERGLFPFLLQSQRRFFGYVSKGYWLDIGTVEQYLQAHLDILKPRQGRPILGRGTNTQPFARFAGGVCIGKNCRIGKGALLEDCVILDGTIVEDGAVLTRCVVGQNCRIGVHARLSPGTALAAHSKVAAFSKL